MEDFNFSKHLWKMTSLFKFAFIWKAWLYMMTQTMYQSVFFHQENAPFSWVNVSVIQLEKANYEAKRLSVLTKKSVLT